MIEAVRWGMTHYRRTRIGNAFFFTLVTYHRRPILCHPTVRFSLRRAIDDVRKTRSFAINGWVLMPDHSSVRARWRVSD